MQERLRIGIDIGGTFTDFVVFDPATSAVKTLKLLSTPENPAKAVLAGLRHLLGPDHKEISIIHGSTVATNALLERKGAITALIATAGFRDVLQIGRQDRPRLYDFFANPPPPLVPDDLRYEVDERVDKHGNILVPLNSAQIEDLIPPLKAYNVESIAVCLLFSFVNPEHENIIARDLRNANYFVSVSSEVLPEFREYERTSTTAVNAYVSPILDRYFTQLEADIHTFPNTKFDLAIMQSNGGVIGLYEAKSSGVRCILSGPAGGVTGSTYIARQIQMKNYLDTNKIKIITFDMGGTSTDVSLIDGESLITTEAQIGGCPIRIPMLDIHTIGAGGGSIASVDKGGALRVGPESAGAYPGPACYGFTASQPDLPLLPTVTDANLILGRILADHFLDGKVTLDMSLAHQALADISAQLQIETHRTALGVIEVVNAHMERALRVISVERGCDPRDFILFAYGGAGGQHAAELARRIGIPKVIVPPQASTLSAFGMLAAYIVKDYVKTVMLPGSTDRMSLSSMFEKMIRSGLKEIEAQGIDTQEIYTECTLDIRYKGQSYELLVPYTDDFTIAFHQAHHGLYGYSRPGAPLEIVNLRVKAVGKVDLPRLEEKPAGKNDPAKAWLGDREVVLEAEPESIPAYWGENLMAQDEIRGPALIVRPDTTILVGKKDILQVDVFGNYVIHVATL